MSRRARRARRRRHQVGRLRRDLQRAYERMARTAGSYMNMEWLDAAGEAARCADRLARLGHPLSESRAIWQAPAVAHAG